MVRDSRKTVILAWALIWTSVSAQNCPCFFPWPPPPFPFPCPWVAPCVYADNTTLGGPTETFHPKTFHIDNFPPPTIDVTSFTTSSLLKRDVPLQTSVPASVTGSASAGTPLLDDPPADDYDSPTSTFVADHIPTRFTTTVTTAIITADALNCPCLVPWPPPPFPWPCPWTAPCFPVASIVTCATCSPTSPVCSQTTLPTTSSSSWYYERDEPVPLRRWNRYARHQDYNSNPDSVPIVTTTGPSWPSITTTFLTTTETAPSPPAPDPSDPTPPSTPDNGTPLSVAFEVLSFFAPAGSPNPAPVPTPTGPDSSPTDSLTVRTNDVPSVDFAPIDTPAVSSNVTMIPAPDNTFPTPVGNASQPTPKGLLEFLTLNATGTMTTIAYYQNSTNSTNATSYYPVITPTTSSGAFNSMTIQLFNPSLTGLASGSDKSFALDRRTCLLGVVVGVLIIYVL